MLETIIPKNLILRLMEVTRDEYEGRLIPGAATFNKQGVQGFVGLLDDHTALVCARGSDETIDWLRNFSFSKNKLILPYPEIMDPNSKVRVHSGFFDNGWMQVRVDVHHLITEVRRDHPQINQIIFAGHSHGGPIAELGALDYQYNLSIFEDPLAQHIICLTFGAPKTGNAAFGESRRKRVPHTLHIVNEDDPVPNLPYWVMGYRRSEHRLHIGKQRWYRRLIFSRTKSHVMPSYITNMSAFEW